MNVALDFADFFKVPLSETVREVSFTRNGEFKRFRMKEEKLKTSNRMSFDCLKKRL